MIIGDKMKNYQELDVWKKSMLLVKEVYALARLLPKEETFALSDQMRRAVVSVPSNIAEGYGRNTTNEYIRFLNIASGSRCELETQLYICIMQGYFSKKDAQMCFELSEDVGKMLSVLIKRLKEK